MRQNDPDRTQSSPEFGEPGSDHEPQQPGRTGATDENAPPAPPQGASRGTAGHKSPWPVRIAGTIVVLAIVAILAALFLPRANVDVGRGRAGPLQTDAPYTARQPTNQPQTVRSMNVADQRRTQPQPTNNQNQRSQAYQTPQTNAQSSQYARPWPQQAGAQGAQPTTSQPTPQQSAQSQQAAARQAARQTQQPATQGATQAAQQAQQQAGGRAAQGRRQMPGPGPGARNRAGASTATGGRRGPQTADTGPNVQQGPASGGPRTGRQTTGAAPNPRQPQARPSTQPQGTQQGDQWGTCPACNGRGWIPCPFPAWMHTKDGHIMHPEGAFVPDDGDFGTELREDLKGGICPYCHGNLRMGCPTCAGRGKVRKGAQSQGTGLNGVPDYAANPELAAQVQQMQRVLREMGINQ